MQSSERASTQELRFGLQAIGDVLGLPITVNHGDGWELTAVGLEVGLEWYAARGHGTGEALSLAALQLWEGPREHLAAPERARRRASIERQAPQEAPLLGVISRLLAAGELLAAFPGLGSRLSAALQRGVRSDVRSLPRHLQWASFLIEAFTQGLAEACRRPVDSAVDNERRILLGYGEGIDPLRRVLLPDPKRSPLQRFERAYALLQPAYARLLALDLEAQRGLANHGGHDHAETTEDTENRGEGPASEMEGEPEDARDDESLPDEAAENEQVDDTSRRDELAQTPGGELTAAQHQEFASTVLATPVPARSGMLEQLLDVARPERHNTPDADASRAGAGSPHFAKASAEYRARVRELTPAIERMRQLWERVITERVAPKRAPSRSAQIAGEDLASDSLARAVAEVRAGISEPHAFRGRVLRSRRTRRVGNTDYLLIVDCSASMQGRTAAAAADAMLVLVESLAGVARDVAHAERLSGTDLNLDIRTGLIVYAGEARLLKPLSHGIDDATRRELRAAVLTPGGSTNDGAALRIAAEQFGLGTTLSGDGAERRRVAILVSDGGSNDRAAATRQLAKLRAHGVRVHGVGIGSEDIVERYAPFGHRIDDARELIVALESIVSDELP